MKIQVLRAALVLAACLASAFAHAREGVVLEARGEASYRIPILVPPGPAGHQPDLALVYASGAGKGAAGWLGFGWSLAGESRIERETRSGTPYDFDNLSCGAGSAFPCYRSAYALDGQQLVCSSGTCSTCTSAAPCRYRTQSDDGRIIAFKGDASGWEIEDREGRTLIYGASSAGTGRLLNPPSIIGTVFSWQIESSTDVNGNLISYSYDTASSPNIAYLKKLEYGQGATANRSVEFILNDPTTGPRPDKPVSARNGFRQQTDRRVVSIEVRGASNALVTRYDLTYSQDPDSLRSQLATVSRKGSDGVASLPPYAFDYSFRAATRGFLGTSESSFVPSATSCWPDGGLLASPYPGVIQSIADMNRDGLGDLYQVTNTSYGYAAPGIVAVALGTGSRFRPGPGENCSSYSAYGLGTPWSPYRLLFAATDGGSAVMDFDADGYLDHFYDSGFPNWAPYDPAFGLRRGSAGGFIDPPLITSFELEPANYGLAYIRLSTTDTYSNVDVISALADVTGDGRPDLVGTQRAMSQYYDGTGYDISWGNSWTGWAVFVNRGLKSGAGGSCLDFAGEPTRWPAPLNAAIQNDYQGLISTFILADQNGDGLADRIYSNAVEYGYGAGFYAQETLSSGIGMLAATVNCTAIGTYDLNGDGFLDHIDAQGTSSSNPNWTVHFGTGHGFSSQAKVFPSDGGEISSACIEGNGADTASASLRDVNGDGVPDRLRYQIGVRLNAGALDPNAVADPNLPSAALPGLLLRATDPLGGIVEFSYQGAPQMKDAAGLPANPDFAPAKPVVTRVRHRDGRSGTPAITTNFWYGDGAFDYAEKEFRGFGTVVATQVENGASATQTTSTYLTDRVCAFSPATTQVALGATVFARETFTYQTVTGGGTVPSQWTKCLLSTSTAESVEGSEATKKARRTAWDYGTPIDANYNLAKLQEWGEWDLATDQDVPGDERITEFGYGTASTNWPSIVSRVTIETVKDSAGNIYSKRQYCYVLACANVAQKGQLVRVRDYLTDYFASPPVIDSPRTVATIVYDAYGNPTQTTGAVTSDDANGLQTAIAYDTTYRTFPTSVSRGFDVALPLQPLVTTLSYSGCAGGSPPPAALGLPCSVTVPQGQAHLLGYDPFGRVTHVERPASGYLETRSYTLPGSASPGQNVLEARIIVSGASDLVERQYLDGLSRVYRRESPGKQSQTAIVDRSFDDRGRLRTESLPYFAGGGPLRTFWYDALGRPTIALDPDGVTQRVLGYTPWSEIDEVYFGAATPGNRKQRTERSSDGLGRLVRVAQFEDAVAATTPYLVTAKYDAADRLYEVRDPIANDVMLCTSLEMGGRCPTQDHVTEIQWDTFGRRVRIDDPDSGVWSFTYDDAGLLKARTQNAGTGSARTQLITYDALERPTAKTLTPTGNGIADASFSYDNSPASSSFGLLLSLDASGGTSYLYGYDAAGRRDSIIQRTAGKEFRSAYEYDALDRLTRRQFPDDDAFDYGYDGARLVEIRADPGNAAFTGTVLRYADYDALGRMKRVEIGEGTGSAALATNTYSYDPTSTRLTRVTGSAANLSPNDPDGDRVPAASDQCLHAYDPDQTDVGGVGETSSPDGIGNGCQCGDVDATGRVSIDDAFSILMQGLSLAPLARPDLCDVDGNGRCDPYDAVAVLGALWGAAADLQHCAATLPGNVPSSAPLDLEVAFDGLGRLTSQTGSLGGEPVSRSYSYDGLSRLSTAVGPWERARGEPGPVTWSYSYDALGNLRKQQSSRPVTWNGDHRTWIYGHASKPRFLLQFADEGGLWESIGATPGGEAASVRLGAGLGAETLTWNALGKLHRYKDSVYSYDVFGERTLAVTGPSGATTSIVSVGEDFEYDIGASRANKSFSVDGVRIASLATSYAAESASVPLPLRIVLRYAEPLAAPAAAALLALALASLASLTLRRRTPVWLSAPGVGVLAFALVVLPYTAHAATLTTGAGKYGRHGEPILAYLVDHLGTVRAAVNQDGIVLETRDYAPFGESIAHAGVFSVQHRFTGQPQDDQAGGLYNYGARFYNPKWGRFISPDQMVQSLDSQGLNPFAYVLNRPTSATDPTGEFIWNGVSYGAWSTATLQSGVLGSNYAGRGGASSGASTTGAVSGIAGGFRLLAMLGPGSLGLRSDSTPRPPPGVLATLAKVLLTDLEAAWLGPISQILFNPILAVGQIIDSAVNRDLGGMWEGAWQLISGTLVPRYGLQNGPYWGRDKSTNEKLDSVLDQAGFEHDRLCKGGCTSEADATWMRIAWSDPWRLGPYGQAYRLLGSAAFGARILFRSATGAP